MIDKKNLPKNVKILDNDQMEVTITYDVTDHGHTFGKPRNYDVNKIKAMINDSSTQEEIKNGYAKGYYGHSKRNINNGYLPSETDAYGNEVEPVCVTKSLSIRGNKITHMQRIFNTEQGKKVQKLILNGGVGFSNVWNIERKKFFGYDVVVSPNFAGNRVIVDSICNGACEIDSVIDNAIIDTVGSDASDEIKDIAKELLMKDETVMDMIRIKDFIQELKEDKSNIEINLSQIKKALEAAKEEKEELNLKLNKELEKNKKIKNKRNKLKDNYNNIITQLDGLGIKQENGKLKMEMEAINSLFKPSDFNKIKKVDFNSIKMLEKGNFDTENRPKFLY